MKSSSREGTRPSSREGAHGCKQQTKRILKSMSLIPPEGISFYGEKPTISTLSLDRMTNANFSNYLMPIFDCSNTSVEKEPEEKSNSKPPSRNGMEDPFVLGNDKKNEKFGLQNEDYQPAKFPSSPPRIERPLSKAKKILTLSNLGNDSEQEETGKLSDIVLANSFPLESSMPAISRHRRRATVDAAPPHLPAISSSQTVLVAKNKLLVSRTPSSLGASKTVAPNFHRRHTSSDIPNEAGDFSLDAYLGWEVLVGKKRQLNWACQDRLVIAHPFDNDIGGALFGVCDGHGSEGHKAAEFCAVNFPTFLRNSLHQSSRTQPVVDSVLELNQELLHSDIDTSFSGCTLCCAFFSLKKQHIKIINVGDSRCCIIQNDRAMGNAYNFSITALSEDHKPNLSVERERIEQQGGVVDKFAEKDKEWLRSRQICYNEYPYRVWRPYANVPGLAMSRSIGDSFAKDVGVICEPQVQTHRYSKQDQYIIIASDGIWDVFSNQQVLALLLPYLKIDAPPSRMAQMLCKSAQKKWLETKSVSDDISCIVINIPKLIEAASG